MGGSGLVCARYATGGSNSGECWQAPRDLGNFLDSQTEESCTQYNVLKVARRSFLTSASASKADFYERAILNGIIGNQNKDDPDGATSYIYMQPLGGVNVKPWGKSDYVNTRSICNALLSGTLSD